MDNTPHLTVLNPTFQPKVPPFALHAAPETYFGLPKKIKLRTDLVPGRKIRLQTERLKVDVTILVRKGRAVTFQTRQGELISYHG